LHLANTAAIKDLRTAAMPGMVNAHSVFCLDTTQA